MPAYIIRTDKNVANERWLLDIANGLVTLTTPDGRVLIEWSAAEAARAVEFPSFFKSVKYTGFNVAGHGVYRFSIDAASLRALRAFVDRGIVAGGRGAIRSRLLRAIAESAGGCIITVLGVILTCVTVREVATGESLTHGESHPAGVVTAIVGFAMLCHGVYGIWHYFQLDRLDRSDSRNSLEESNARRG
jgi:hypothetical protein